MSKVESINRQTWRNPLERRYYRNIHGFLNQGEEFAFELGLAAATGGEVLDIGVGAGRTTEILASRAGRYVGIDYTAEMIALCRKKYPDLRFEVMDARDLGAFADSSFDLVVFSFNGIDSVEGEGRLRIFSEVARVLRPGGAFVFSTFNRGWKGFGDAPRNQSFTWTAQPLRLGYHLAMQVISSFRRLWLRRYQIHGEHAVLLHPAHHYGIMVYATTPAQLHAQLTAAALADDIRIFSLEGVPLRVDATYPDTEYFHVVATLRKV